MAVVVAWLATRDTADLVRAVVGAGLAYVRLRGAWFVYPRGMGFGDVRLSAVLGCALGLPRLGAAVRRAVRRVPDLRARPGCCWPLVRRDRRLLRTAYPFGPFMIVGALIGVLWGTDLWARFIGGMTAVGRSLACHDRLTPCCAG